jgi:ADP-ribose pyrophosphatase YjhB (NUDIX family)
MIEELESLIGDPSKGLPEDVFLFLSRVTPMINVDLLIQDEAGRTLLTWREDAYNAPGWHIPGGIIRFKETFADRIHAVARLELGTTVSFREEPLAVNQVIHPSRKDRGHFISLLYACRLLAPPDEGLRHSGGVARPGAWAWHVACPEKLISVHEMYRRFLPSK